jgi:lysophospholipase L1-like esterase
VFLVTVRPRGIALILTVASLSVAACDQIGTAPAAADPTVWPGPVPPPPPPPAPRIQFTKYLAFGDSLTEGFLKGLVGQAYVPEIISGQVDPRTPGPTTGFPFKLKALLATRYIEQSFVMYDAGWAGHMAEQEVHDGRLTAVLNYLPDQPEVLILMEGVNDLNAGSNVPKVVGFLQQLVNQATSRGMRVIVSTLPPEREPTDKGPGNAVVADFNRTLKSQITGATVVDVNPAVTSSMIGPDGTHLLEIGNQTLAEVYFAKLMELFEIPATQK